MFNPFKFSSLQLSSSFVLSVAVSTTFAGTLGGGLGGGTTSGGYSASSVYSTCSSVGDSTSGTSLGGSLGSTSGSGTIDCANEDSDGDFMQNTWELTYSLNKNSKADAYQDSDGDGASNQEEAAKGTKPKGSGTACPGFSTTTLTDSDCDGVTDGDDPAPTNASITKLTVDGTYKGKKLQETKLAQ